jgi:general stress protein 26
LQIDSLLDGASRTIAGLRSCWLVTRNATGAPFARPMGVLPADPAQADWCPWLLAGTRSGKARDIAAEPRVTLIYQRGDEAYVTLSGVASIVTDAAEVARRWKPRYDAYFADRRHGAFIEVRADHMQLWILGVTPEPFGVRTTDLRRGADGGWRLAPEGSER